MTHKGVIDEDFPGSWECARCCSQGKTGQGKVLEEELGGVRRSKEELGGVRRS